MKKFFVFAAAALTLTFASCGKKAEVKDGEMTDSIAQTEATCDKECEQACTETTATTSGNYSADAQKVIDLCERMYAALKECKSYEEILAFETSDLGKELEKLDETFGNDKALEEELKGYGEEFKNRIELLMQEKVGQFAGIE